MLYPANHDIRLLQNSTWRMPVRVTQSARTIANMSVSAGAPTFTAGAGATIRSANSAFKTAYKYAAVNVICIGTNEYLISGEVVL